MSKFPLLIIGAGELGSAILDAVLDHPQFDSKKTKVVLLLRMESLNSDNPAKQSQIQHYRHLGIQFEAADIDNDSLDSLTTIFKSYTTVIQAAGMTSPAGTMTKITQAVLDASVQYYIPWQHGVDYDVIGREGGQGLFSEQVGIREMLRTQRTTQWTVISCGIFMSFLFEDFWGVVTRIDEDKVKVTALNSWDDMITTTSARDIGRCTAELLVDSETWDNRPTYIAGDTLSYRTFADIIERESGREVSRDVWPLAYLLEESKRDPDNKLKKYHVVFSEGTGLSWPKENTWNAQKDMSMEDVATWVRNHLKRV